MSSMTNACIAVVIFVATAASVADAADFLSVPVLKRTFGPSSNGLTFGTTLSGSYTVHEATDASQRVSDALVIVLTANISMANAPTPSTNNHFHRAIIAGAVWPDLSSVNPASGLQEHAIASYQLDMGDNAAPYCTGYAAREPGAAVVSTQAFQPFRYGMRGQFNARVIVANNIMQISATFAWTDLPATLRSSGSALRFAATAAVQYNVGKSQAPGGDNCTLPPDVLNVLANPGTTGSSTGHYAAFNLDVGAATSRSTISQEPSGNCAHGVPLLIRPNGAQQWACANCFRGWAANKCHTRCECDSPYGTCSSGTQGDGSCTSCNANRFGPDCTGLCSCDSSGSLSCDAGPSGSGTCTCRTNYGGTTCGDCDVFHYGASCAKICQCQQGICRSGRGGDGACTVCNTGKAGPYCNITCPSSCPVGLACVNDVTGGVCRDPSATPPPPTSVSGTKAPGSIPRRISITFKTTISSFDTQKCRQVIAAAVNVAVDNVVIVSIVAGSVIVDVRFSGMTASASEQSYSSLETLIRTNDDSLSDLPAIEYFTRTDDSSNVGTTSPVGAPSTTKSPGGSQPPTGTLPQTPGEPVAPVLPGQTPAGLPPAAIVAIAVVLTVVVVAAAVAGVVVLVLRARSAKDKSDDAATAESNGRETKQDGEGAAAVHSSRTSVGRDAYGTTTVPMPPDALGHEDPSDSTMHPPSRPATAVMRTTTRTTVGPNGGAKSTTTTVSLSAHGGRSQIHHPAEDQDAHPPKVREFAMVNKTPQKKQSDVDVILENVKRNRRAVIGEDSDDDSHLPLDRSHDDKERRQAAAAAHVAATTTLRTSTHSASQDRQTATPPITSIGLSISSSTQQPAIGGSTSIVEETKRFFQETADLARQREDDRRHGVMPAGSTPPATAAVLPAPGTAAPSNRHLLSPDDEQQQRDAAPSPNGGPRMSPQTQAIMNAPAAASSPNVSPTIQGTTVVRRKPASADGATLPPAPPRPAAAASAPTALHVPHIDHGHRATGAASQPATPTRRHDDEYLGGSRTPPQAPLGGSGQQGQADPMTDIDNCHTSHNDSQAPTRQKKAKHCKYCGGVFGQIPDMCPVEKRSHIVLKSERRAEKKEKKARKQVTAANDSD